MSADEIKEVLRDSERAMQKAIDAMEGDFQTMRTGRASPALVERIPVEYYGSEVPILQLATIAIPEPQQILIKPFDVAELKARLRALLRRSFQRPQPALEYRGISLDPASQVVEYQGQTINLPRKEFLLLHELLIQPGRVLTRDKLQQALYGWDKEVESNALEVHVHHLRKKFFPELIRTVRGVGYLVDK